jgi:predicted DNA-binding transcriptional regulator AlpA
MTKFLDLDGLYARYPGVNRSTFYRWGRNPRVGFPRPVKFGSRSLWSIAELDEFDARRIAERDRAVIEFERAVEENRR